jgi:hypothetical protein
LIVPGRKIYLSAFLSVNRLLCLTPDRHGG